MISTPYAGSVYGMSRCLGGERACPPEDCGGPGGYAELLEAVADPKHPEHDGYLERAGDDFDPERFDLDSVNRIFARYAPRRKRGRHASPARRRS